jgi:hypothetical protein
MSRTKINWIKIKRAFGFFILLKDHSQILRAVVAKNRAEKSDLLRSSSSIAILKALFYLSMLANFQTNRMILAIFLGLERSMMVKIIIFEFLF